MENKPRESHKAKEDSSPREQNVEIVLPEGVNVEEDREITKEDRQGLLKILTKAIGLDITTIALPVTLNEPLSFIQRMCEQLQYSDLLDKAALVDDPIQRLLYVSIFVITCFSSTERTAKPFNPLLGETFEFVDEKRNNFRYISEQVCHHPPVGAVYAESDNFIFYQHELVKTKFTGNSLELQPVGTSHVILKSTNEHFIWNPIKTVAHNVILGKLWVDNYGELEVINLVTGAKAKIEFIQCGWFSKGWHEVNGTVYDHKGNAGFSIFGKWNHSVYAKLLNPSLLKEFSDDDESEPSSDAAAETNSSEEDKSSLKKEKKQQKEQEKKEKKEKKKMQKEIKLLRKQIKKKLTSQEPLWVHTITPLEKLDCKYMSDWTSHTLELCELTEEMRPLLPPTDSRLRPDRAALEKSDTKKAGVDKLALEEKQRQEARKRIGEWVPRYFKKFKDEKGEDSWEYTGTYWNERAKRTEESKRKN